jgi:hypothetical protein
MGKSARWQPKPPPAEMTRQHPPRPATCDVTGGGRGGGGGGATCHFSNSSLTKDYFKILISHNRSAKLATSVLQCQSLPISFLQAVKRENVSYIVTRAHKRPPGPARLSQSLHYVLQATSLRKTVYTRTKPATTSHVEQ